MLRLQCCCYHAGCLCSGVHLLHEVGESDMCLQGQQQLRRRQHQGFNKQL
jgi:hypothetical protein